MSAKPRMFYERDRNIVHCEGVLGGDFTLCGFTLDGDQGDITETHGCRVNCPNCLSVINFCRGLTSRALARS